ncbi:X-ray repair cross-complementing protein 6, partial [Podochytrium sp. JEL0797]
MPSWSHRANEDDFGDESDDELAAEERKQSEEQQRDCLVYLIDSSPPMHSAPDPDSATPFQQCVAAVAAQHATRIINDHKDKVAVVLYGAKTANNSLGFAGINVLQDLDEPSAERINQLEQLDQSQTLFDTTIGSTEQFTLHEALWTANQIFAKSAKKNDYKRVFIMTNTSHPHEGSPELERLACTRAKDLQDTNVIVYLFGLEKIDADTGNVTVFDFDAFFKPPKDNIIPSPEDAPLLNEDGTQTNTEDQDGETRFFNASGGLSALTAKVEQKVFKKRSSFACPMVLGEGVEFGVKGYNLVSEVKLVPATHLVAATNEEAAVQTSYVCKTTSQQLAVTDMDSYYLYGGEKVVFTKEELAKIKYFGEPSLRLLGFKDSSTVKNHLNLKHSVFVVPDESVRKNCARKGRVLTTEQQRYIGSSSIFIQFLARVHAKNKVVICSYMPKRNMSPRLVALLPQLEEYDEMGNVLRPSGFHMIHLPFMDDRRKPDAPSFSMEASFPVLEPATRVFHSIIDKTTIKNFSVNNYKNPTLQNHYANLQAVALKRDEAQETQDSTLPNTEAIQKRITRFLPQLLETLPNEPDPVPTATGSKRAAAAAGDDEDNTPAAKKPRAAAAELDNDGIQAAWEADGLTRLTVPVLKAFVKRVGAGSVTNLKK